VVGTNLSTASAAQRDRLRADHLGVVFQQFNLLPYLTVMENVLLPTRFSSRRLQQAEVRFGSARAQAQHLLEALGLAPALWSSRANQISLGQQQRVAVCRALMGSPALVIADEPTSALDEDNRQSFLELLLRAQQEQGAALVMVSHDRRMASSFGQVLDLGRGH
jgi:putative ABC transport system ATP-binding protein